MNRINPVNAKQINGKAQELLDGVQKKLGMTPNMMKTMANAPATLDAYLSFSGALSQGTLSGKLREQIALVVGETNSCDYCLAAHCTIGGSLGLSAEEMLDNRAATSSDSKTEAVLRFAREIVTERGLVSEETFDAVRDAGFTDGEITEIIANVALNLFTNYFNHIAGTTVDFPAAQQLAAK